VAEEARVREDGPDVPLEIDGLFGLEAKGDNDAKHHEILP
jgi:hypothetical protein